MLQQLLSAVPLPAYACDAEGRITGCNALAVEIWGRQPRLDDDGDRWCGASRRWHRDGRPQPREDCCMAVALRQRRSQTGETILDAAGGRRAFTAHVQVLHDEAGELVGAVGVLQPVPTPTDLGLLRLQAAFASVVDGVIVADVEGNLVDWNPAALRLFGFANAEEVRRHHSTFADIFELTQRDGTVVAVSQWPMARLGRGEPVIDLEMHVRRRDTGGEWDIRFDGAVVADPAGGPRLVVLSLHDLTAQNHSLELLRSIQGSVSDAILSIDQGGRIRSANAAAEILFGHELGQLIGLDIALLMPQWHRRAHAAGIERYVRTGQARLLGDSRELEGLRRDGTVFPIELTVTEFWLSGERHFTGVVRDLTARKRLEAQLLQAQKMEAVGRLAGGIAHDFNNLLTVISGQCELLLSHTPGEAPGRAALAMIHEAGQRAARLTRQLLTFSHRTVISRQVVDLVGLIAGQQAELQRLLGDGVELVLTLAPQPLGIEADAGLLEQALRNLVLNAREAMPQGGRVDVTVGEIELDPARDAHLGHVPPGRYVQLAVADTGCGMTEATKAVAFEPFFTTKPSGSGKGLGLAVVHGAVQQSGGHVGVVSEVGRGSTFALLFTPAPGTAAAAVATEPRGSETVLLVEDEAGVREVARTALQGFGYAVLEAAGGAEAIEVARAHGGGIDVLVTDVVMPQMRGDQLAAALRQARPGLRVLYVSGYVDDGTLRDGIAANREQFLAKPFTPLALAQKVRAVLDGR